MSLADTVRMRKQPENEIELFVKKAFHLWSKRQPDQADDVISPDLREHTWGVTGIAEIQEICYAMHDALSDYHIDILDVISQGDLIDGKISCRFSASGKWVNEYCGVAPNNEVITFPGALTWVVKEGKVTDSWIYQSYADVPELGHAILCLSKEAGVYC